MGKPITVTFSSEQEVQRLLYLVSRDLARVVGSEVIARERLEAFQNRERSLSGRQRKKAVSTIESAPTQASVLEAAQRALQDGLRGQREGEDYDYETYED